MSHEASLASLAGVLHSTVQSPGRRVVACMRCDLAGLCHCQSQSMPHALGAWQSACIRMGLCNQCSRIGIAHESTEALGHSRAEAFTKVSTRRPVNANIRFHLVTSTHFVVQEGV